MCFNLFLFWKNYVKNQKATQEKTRVAKFIYSISIQVASTKHKSNCNKLIKANIKKNPRIPNNTAVATSAATLRTASIIAANNTVPIAPIAKHFPFSQTHSLASSSENNAININKTIANNPIPKAIQAIGRKLVITPVLTKTPVMMPNTMPIIVGIIHLPHLHSHIINSLLVGLIPTIHNIHVLCKLLLFTNYI